MKTMTAEQFKAARQRLGLTQQGLADALYCDLRTVQRWEAGDRAVPGPAVKALEMIQRSGS